MNIGEIKAGTANVVEGTQNIGQQGGTLHLAAEDKDELSKKMREIFFVLGELSDFLNHEAGLCVPSSLCNDAATAHEQGALRLRDVRRINGEITPEVKSNISVYLQAAESVMRAAQELYKDTAPFLEKAIPAIGVVKRIFGL